MLDRECLDVVRYECRNWLTGLTGPAGKAGPATDCQDVDQT